MCHDNAVPVLLSVGSVPRGQWWANTGWHWHLAVTPANTDVPGKYCTFSNSEPRWLLIRLLRRSGLGDIHSFQLDLGEKGEQACREIIGVNWHILYLLPCNPVLKCSFPWETKITLGWVGLSDLFQVRVVPSHSWLNLFLCICGWVERGWWKRKQTQDHPAVHWGGEGSAEILCAVWREEIPSTKTLSYGPGKWTLEVSQTRNAGSIHSTVSASGLLDQTESM